MDVGSSSLAPWTSGADADADASPSPFLAATPIPVTAFFNRAFKDMQAALPDNPCNPLSSQYDPPDQGSGGSLGFTATGCLPQTDGPIIAGTSQASVGSRLLPDVLAACPVQNGIGGWGSVGDAPLRTGGSQLAAPAGLSPQPALPLWAASGQGQAGNPCQDIPEVLGPSAAPWAAAGQSWASSPNASDLNGVVYQFPGGP